MPPDPSFINEAQVEVSNYRENIDSRSCLE
jgi:hypothetical protein